MTDTTVPAIGLGTSGNDDPDQCARSVATAIEAGYRHIDTAQLYGNERYVGEGIARADVPREDVLVATKVKEDRNAHEAVMESTDRSLERLGIDTIDLLYVHWPVGDYAPAETLPAFNELHEAGKIRCAGVSNFSARQVETALEVLEAPLIANQVEIHPLLPPREAHLESAREHDYQLVAYAPFCRGEVFGTEAIRDVARKHGVSQAQVCLAWLWDHDRVVAIPKATGRDHIEENLAARSIELDPEDRARIDAIDRRYRRFDNREGAPWK